MPQRSSEPGGKWVEDFRIERASAPAVLPGIGPFGPWARKRIERNLAPLLARIQAIEPRDRDYERVNLRRLRTQILHASPKAELRALAERINILSETLGEAARTGNVELAFPYFSANGVTFGPVTIG